MPFTPLSQAVRPIEILMVEDNPADVRLTRLGFEEARIANDLIAVGSGDEALDYLFRRGRHAGARRPDLILLDLKLPGVDGHEVLRQIKGDDDLSAIPVIMLTSSEAESDVLKSYRLHANCYIAKPVNFDGLISVVNAIDHFWFTVVSLPPRDR